MHSSLAVTLDGLPLGLSAIKFWTRTKFKGTAALKKKINLTRVSIEEKESIRWLQNMRQSIALFDDPARCVLTKGGTYRSLEAANDVTSLSRKTTKTNLRAVAVEARCTIADGAGRQRRSDARICWLSLRCLGTTAKRS